MRVVGPLTNVIVEDNAKELGRYSGCCQIDWLITDSLSAEREKLVVRYILLCALKQIAAESRILPAMTIHVFLK